LSIYTDYRCPNCNKSLAWSGKGSIEIGIPFILCNSCGSTINMDPVITEWELMNPKDRKRIQLQTLKNAFLVGGAIGFIIAMIIDYYWMGKNEISVANTITFVAIGSIFCYSFLRIRLSKRIKMSIDRMSDPAYRQKLISLRIMK